MLSINMFNVHFSKVLKYLPFWNFVAILDVVGDDFIAYNYNSM